MACEGSGVLSSECAPSGLQTQREKLCFLRRADINRLLWADLRATCECHVPRYYWKCEFCSVASPHVRLPQPARPAAAEKDITMHSRLICPIYRLILEQVASRLSSSINEKWSVDYLILAELSSKPFYVLWRLADLRCQTSRVSHLRIFLINIFHLPEGLAEWESNKRRKGKWLLVAFGSLRSKQFKQTRSSRLHEYYPTLPHLRAGY